MSSSDTPATTLTVRSPADLACVVPYLLGFHPGHGSLVVTAFAGNSLVFGARVDLPDPQAPAAEVHDLADYLVPVLRQQRSVTDVALIGYGHADHIDPALHLVEQAFTAAGITVQDLLRVADARVFTIDCDDPNCCPPQGTPFDPSASPVAAHATVAGLVAFPDRAAVAARIAPVDDAARHSMHQATGRALTRWAALRAAGPTAIQQAGTHALDEALRQHDAGQQLTDDQVAWLTVLLNRTAVRDLALELTQPHERHVAFWADITRRAEPRFVPAPATLLALTAWRCGNGALATMAAEHALCADPGYRLAGLLLRALHAGLPPSTFEQATTDDRAEPPKARTRPPNAGQAPTEPSRPDRTTATTAGLDPADENGDPQ